MSAQKVIKFQPSNYGQNLTGYKSLFVRPGHIIYNLLLENDDVNFQWIQAYINIETWSLVLTWLTH